MVRLENVLKISLQEVLKISWRHLEDVFETCWRRLEDALKMSWRRFEDVLKTSSKRLEDVLKMSWRLLEDIWQDEYIGLEDVLKTSSEDGDERRLQDVFIKTNVCWEITGIALLICLVCIPIISNLVKWPNQNSIRVATSQIHCFI